MEDIQKKVHSFFSQFPKKQFKKGEVLLSPENMPSGVYYITDGFVREYSISSQGVELTIHTFSPRSYFPLTWALCNIANRYFYEALTDIEVFQASKEKVAEFLQNEPDVVFDLTKRLLSGLDRLSSRIEGFVYNEADEKLISVLVYLARHFGISTGKGVQLRMKFTHRDIASFAGISRETASRAWEKLKKSGIIESNDQFIIIRDLTALKEKLSKE